MGFSTAVEDKPFGIQVRRFLILGDKRPQGHRENRCKRLDGSVGIDLPRPALRQNAATPSAQPGGKHAPGLVAHSKNARRRSRRLSFRSRSPAAPLLQDLVGLASDLDQERSQTSTEINDRRAAPSLRAASKVESMTCAKSSGSTAPMA